MPNGNTVFRGVKEVCIRPFYRISTQQFDVSIVCSHLETIENGMTIVEDVAVNGTATFSCNVGYNLFGSPTRKCQPNGKWDGDNAYCQSNNDPCMCSLQLLWILIHSCFNLISC